MPMLTRIFYVAGFLLLCGSAHADPVLCASWKDADKALRAAWAKGYPKEKILKLESNGAPSSYEKMKPTGDTKIDEHGRTWEYYQKNTFCRVPAKAVVEQPSGPRNFEISAIFRKDGSRFVFDDIGVGESTAVANAGQEAPAKEEIKKLIAAYWEQQHPGSKVENVAISAPELKKDTAKGRWWYTTGADIFITDTAGVKQKCSNDYTTLHKGEKGQEGVAAAGEWKVYFLDSPTCKTS